MPETSFIRRWWYLPVSTVFWASSWATLWRHSSTIWSSEMDAAVAALPTAELIASAFQLTLERALQLQSSRAAIRIGISLFIFYFG